MRGYGRPTTYLSVYLATDRENEIFQMSGEGLFVLAAVGDVVNIQLVDNDEKVEHKDFRIIERRFSVAGYDFDGAGKASILHPSYGIEWIVVPYEDE